MSDKTAETERSSFSEPPVGRVDSEMVDVQKLTDSQLSQKYLLHPTSSPELGQRYLLTLQIIPGYKVNFERSIQKSLPSCIVE